MFDTPGTLVIIRLEKYPDIRTINAILVV